MRYSRGFSLLVVLVVLAGCGALIYAWVALLPVYAAEQAAAAQRTRLRQDAAALLRLARSQRSLIESQNDMIRVHRELLDTGREVKAIDDDPGSCPNQASLEDAARFVRTA